MFKKMPVCRLMISCPSDVNNEIKIINRVVDNINDSIGMSMDIFVKTLHWSKNITPGAGDYAQNLINEQILDKADIIIAIFGNKIGSATQNYESGTIEEIEYAIQEKKKVFVYFSNKPIHKNEIDIDQEQKIRVFKDKYKNQGVYVEYCSDKEFSDSITRNLTRYLTAELSREANTIDEKTRFNDEICQRKEIDLLGDYTRFRKIKPIVFNAAPNIMKIVTHKDCFDIDIDIRNVKMMDAQGFAMAVFEYTPCDDWVAFYEASYFLEFDTVSMGGIKAFQLEIKNDIRNKIIDEMVRVSDKGEHFQIWLPSATRDMSAWRNISQICFTVFFSEEYICEKKGSLCIKKLKLIPK